MSDIEIDFNKLSAGHRAVHALDPERQSTKDISDALSHYKELTAPLYDNPPYSVREQLSIYIENQAKSFIDSVDDPCWTDGYKSIIHDWLIETSADIHTGAKGVRAAIAAYETASIDVTRSTAFLRLGQAIFEDIKIACDVNSYPCPESFHFSPIAAETFLRSLSDVAANEMGFLAPNNKVGERTGWALSDGTLVAWSETWPIPGLIESRRIFVTAHQLREKAIALESFKF